MDRRLARGADDEVARARGRLERAMGKAIGDPADPLLGVGALGGQVLDARHDGHRPQPRPQRPVGGGSGQADRRRAVRLRLVPPVRRRCTGASCSTSPARHFDELFDAAKELAGTTSDARVPDRAAAATWSTPTSTSSRRHTGQPFPQDPAAQLRGAIEAVFRSWNGPRAIAYRDRERISHDLGTAVNVQAMVFGNRDDQSGTGVGFTRDPATGAAGCLRGLPGQRPGRGRGGRASATPSRSRP